jgi:hypothetical protein
MTQRPRKKPPKGNSPPLALPERHGCARGARAVPVPCASPPRAVAPPPRRGCLCLSVRPSTVARLDHRGPNLAPVLLRMSIQRWLVYPWAMSTAQTRTEMRSGAIQVKRLGLERTPPCDTVARFSESRFPQAALFRVPVAVFFNPRVSSVPHGSPLFPVVFFSSRAFPGVALFRIGYPMTAIQLSRLLRATRSRPNRSSALQKRGGSGKGVVGPCAWDTA